MTMMKRMRNDWKLDIWWSLPNDKNEWFFSLSASLRRGIFDILNLTRGIFDNSRQYRGIFDKNPLFNPTFWIYSRPTLWNPGGVSGFNSDGVPVLTFYLRLEKKRYRGYESSSDHFATWCLSRVSVDLNSWDYVAKMLIFDLTEWDIAWNDKF